MEETWTFLLWLPRPLGKMKWRDQPSSRGNKNLSSSQPAPFPGAVTSTVFERMSVVLLYVLKPWPLLHQGGLESFSSPRRHQPSGLSSALSIGPREAQVWTAQQQLRDRAPRHPQILKDYLTHLELKRGDEVPERGLLTWLAPKASVTVGRTANSVPISV